MVKKSLQLAGLTILIGFSFFYTDKVVNVVRDQDPLMIKIHEYEDSFNKDSINAFVEDDSIIPGINACVVDAVSSYNNMKKVGSYSSNMIEYREIKPKLSLDNIYNKYIIRGNKSQSEAAIVFKINDDKYIASLIKMLTSKNVKASFFVDGQSIESDTQNIYRIINSGNEVYNGGYDGEYDKDLLVWTNNMIDNMSYNKSKYCLVTSDDKDVLSLCAKNKMYTIKSDLVINYSKTFSDIKDSIGKGSIIVFDVNDKTLAELDKTLVFLKGKGFSYNLLSTHLSEKGCN